MSSESNSIVDSVSEQLSGQVRGRRGFVCIGLHKNNSNAVVMSHHTPFTNWSDDNCLPLNIRKCKALVISMSVDCPKVCLPGIVFVKGMNTSVIIFNSKCSWSDHISKVASNASRRMLSLRLLRPLKKGN